MSDLGIDDEPREEGQVKRAKKGKKGKKKGKRSLEPARWDEVNSENDKRYFNVGIDDQSTGVASLSDTDKNLQVGASDFSKIEIIDPIT